MWKLLLISHESSERERIAELVSWEQHGIEISGVARDGREGLEKIEKMLPDIVITEIELPQINGVELIQKASKKYPEIIFIVLSESGDYAYTSAVMECGVRYYIRKPWDRERLEQVLCKVSKQLQKRYSLETRDVAMLLARSENGQEYTFLSFLHNGNFRLHRLIICQKEEQVDIWGQFVLGNQRMKRQSIRNFTKKEHGELPLIFEKESKKEAVFFQAIRRLLEEHTGYNQGKTLLSIHMFDHVAEVRTIDEWPPRPFPIELVTQPERLSDAYFYIKQAAETGVKIPYLFLKDKKDYSEVLFELHIIFCQLAMKKLSVEEMRKAIAVMLGTLYHGGEKELYEHLPKDYSVAEIYQAAQEIVMGEEFGDATGEAQKMMAILQAVYRNLAQEKLGIIWLCKNCLHMNEDYFGRVFTAGMSSKFTDYVIKIRVETALRLLKFEPGISVSGLAELVGYAPDGQHFSKVFKKQIGMSPVQYKNQFWKKED